MNGFLFKHLQFKTENEFAYGYLHCLCSTVLTLYRTVKYSLPEIFPTVPLLTLEFSVFTQP